MVKNIELIVHWKANQQTSFFIDHWKRNGGDIIMYPETTGTPRIHVPLRSIRYFELYPITSETN